MPVPDSVLDDFEDRKEEFDDIIYLSEATKICLT
jgi:hypothetical protein